MGSVDVCGRPFIASRFWLKKIRNSQQEKIPCALVDGDREAKQRAVSFPCAATAETRFEQCPCRCFTLDWHRKSATGETIQWSDFAPCTS
jgi:hypothetical protein